ncbi:hypothetical protein [Xenorhabdus innexi]|uniref:Uncharacterized protein n=1 Tax=Xenorhabdus innexi TaxID=290109 RepID=A0A1N6N1X5_9GAMM|nr:hypothetical protein [Xenorhabdus innexi]PHM37151.1 hypothetical protein Xinn_01118 [Xenorhabdus innexi]SIP75067.1 hypothetical protein XIS1_900102 [Xenorhabdus innexi]
MKKKDYWLENVLDSFFAKERKKQLRKFWSNREPKSSITGQELDTVDVLNTFITVVHKASSREQVVKSPPPNAEIRRGYGKSLERAFLNN